VSREHQGKSWLNPKHCVIAVAKATKAQGQHESQLPF